MDTRRLRTLLELSRHGSMRAVADLLHTSTSTVSQQIAALARETGTALIQPDGRRVVLTPAGRRLAAHAQTVLAAVDAAYADLDPAADPAGSVRVSGFATAIRVTLLPIITELAGSHPGVRVVVSEHEPHESFDLLGRDEVDLALTYDYTLAPARQDASLTAVLLWSAAWSLGVPADAAPPAGHDAVAVFETFRDQLWIGNSRNLADEQVVRTIASMAGFQPNMAHRADSLDLVEDLIIAGMGVGLLPAGRRTRPGVTLVPLANPGVELRAYALTRRGQDNWPPLRLVLDRLTAGHAGVSAAGNYAPSHALT